MVRHGKIAAWPMLRALVLALGIAFAAPAWAQEARDYLPAEFARFAPHNALQILQQVPGFSIRENNAAQSLSATPRAASGPTIPSSLPY